MALAATSFERGLSEARREDAEKRARMTELEAQIAAKRRAIWERAQRDAALTSAAEAEAVELAVSFLTRDVEGDEDEAASVLARSYGALATSVGGDGGFAARIGGASAASRSRASPPHSRGHAAVEDGAVDFTSNRWSERHPGLAHRPGASGGARALDAMLDAEAAGDAARALIERASAQRARAATIAGGEILSSKLE